MNRIRRTLIGSGAVALCWPATVLAQGPARIARVVIAQKANEKSRELWRAEFAKHGWIDGHNLALSFVDIREAPEAEAEARAREVIASRPDAILMLASAEVAIFKRLTKDIPFVFYNGGADPARIGLVESLRRPGGNITGTSLHMDQIWPKAWAMLKEIHPAMKRGGVLVDLEDHDRRPNEDSSRADSVHRESMQAIASRLGIELRDVFVPKGATLVMAMDAIRKSKSEALRIELSWTKFPGLIASLEKARILTCGYTLAFVRDGGLLAVTFDFDEGKKQAVAIVARILRGESPATIPIYESTRYYVAVNLRTARAMGFTIPASIRIQATEVIE
jgi:putative ABC transport system substrate-binding protein